jgi:hypothetical protein
LAHRFNAAPNNPITTLHATAPARNITVAHVPKPKVGSADAAASTVRGRSALIENVLHAVAVPSNAQTEEKRHMDAQRQSVVKRELPAYTALCRHEQRALELRCASFGNWFPRRCNDVSLPPKFHLLTQEIPRFAVRWQTVGLASEQAVESSNRVVNRLDRTYTTIQEKETRLAALVKQLALEHNPAVQVILPRVRLCSQCSLPIAARFPLRCGCKKKL